MAPRFGRRIQKVKRPSRPGRKYYLGSQEIPGSVCEWRVEYWIQRLGDQWLLHTKGEEGCDSTDGLTGAAGLVETVEERGLDLEEYIADLYNAGQPSLTALAREIEGLPSGDGDDGEEC